MLKVSVHKEDASGNVYTLLEELRITWKGKVMADQAVFQSYGTVTGQIDTVCIWDRVLTNDEISLLSKAFKNT